MKKKRIAFIFALPIRTNPILITMPFGLNVITLLDQKGYEIDVFLSEYRSDSYKGLFSENVNVHFLDHNYLWPKEGKPSYYSLTNYFRYKSITSLRNKYSHIFGSGMAGVTLAGILKSQNRKAKFIYMNDEFPDQGTRNIWINSEIKHARKADIVSTPDEVRYPQLCAQIQDLKNKPHVALPNTPLTNEVETTPKIDWHKHFGIPASKKLFLMAGGLQEFNLISELLESVKDWPNDTALILKGKNDVKGAKEKYAHLTNSDKIYWSSESFSPEKLHSLIQYCSASICLYRPINTNLTYVGKSSGKLMRSVLLGKPVIVSNAEGFEFVEELNIGCLVEANSIASGVQYILDNATSLEKNCKENYSKISFESYWKQMEEVAEL